jgi:hypothetical protein
MDQFSPKFHHLQHLSLFRWPNYEEEDDVVEDWLELQTLLAPYIVYHSPALKRFALTGAMINPNALFCLHQVLPHRPTLHEIVADCKDYVQFY